MSASVNQEDEHRNPLASTMTYNKHGKRHTVYNIDANTELQDKIIQHVSPCKLTSSSDKPFKKKRKMFLLVIEEDSDSDNRESKKQNTENSKVVKLLGETDFDNVEINKVQINNNTPENSVLNVTSIKMVTDEKTEQDKKTITTRSASQTTSVHVAADNSYAIGNEISDISVTSQQNNTYVIKKKENSDIVSLDTIVSNNIKTEKLFHPVHNSEPSLIVPKSEPAEGKVRRGRKRIYPVPDSLACSHCGKQLATIAGHRSHEMACMGIKPHVCDICGRGFSQKVTLQCHYATHAEGKPISCELCSRTFNSVERLNRHKLGVHDQSKRIYRYKYFKLYFCVIFLINSFCTCTCTCFVVCDCFQNPEKC